MNGGQLFQFFSLKYSQRTDLICLRDTFELLRLFFLGLKSLPCAHPKATIPLSLDACKSSKHLSCLIKEIFESQPQS